MINKPLKSGDAEITIRFQDDYMTVITHEGDILEAFKASPIHWNKLWGAIQRTILETNAERAKIYECLSSGVDILPIEKMLQKYGFDMQEDGSVSYADPADDKYHVLFINKDGKLHCTQPFRFSYSYDTPVLRERTNIRDYKHHNVMLSKDSRSASK